MTEKNIGSRLSEARKKKGATVEEAARATGLSPERLRDLENGGADDDLLHYAAYLGVGAGESVGGPVMVEAREVNKSYRAEDLVVHALDDVSLKVEEGALVAVMGQSGSGKTTLLNVLSGLDSVDKGEVFIAGEPLHALSDARRTDLRARKMGFVFQGFNLMPVLSAVENVELPLLVLGERKAREKALEVLDLVGLSDRVHNRPTQLSGGQQQRVAIARALVNKPAIVWADEPTGNLDSDTSDDVLDLMLRLNKENDQTFVVVTHDSGVGAKMDRIVRMRDGKIVDEGVDREAG
jgi:putative ABC transport system ATP-binding protein